MKTIKKNNKKVYTVYFCYSKEFFEILYHSHSIEINVLDFL